MLFITCRTGVLSLCNLICATSPELCDSFMLCISSFVGLLHNYSLFSRVCTNFRKYCVGSDESILIEFSSIKLHTLLFKSSLIIITAVFPLPAWVIHCSTQVSVSDLWWYCSLCTGLIGGGFLSNSCMLLVAINLMASHWFKSICWIAFSVSVTEFFKHRLVGCSRPNLRPFSIMPLSSQVNLILERLHTLGKKTLRESDCLFEFLEVCFCLLYKVSIFLTEFSMT
jgi:hypothetical protein